MNVAIIGSSLAGISAAHALVERGMNVTILDVGEQLDQKRQSAVERVRLQEAADWSREDADLIGDNVTFGKGDLPKKMHFGSDYIYAADRSFSHLRTLSQGRVPYPTFAKGGFSNIWGAAALPVAACDMADWPVSREEMDPYFAKVAGFMPICGGEGTLSPTFPTYTKEVGNLDAGPQGDLLLRDLNQAKDQLLARDTVFGKARLAIHTKAAAGGILPCNGCGLCFTGCLRNAIYSTVPDLERFVAERKVTYRSSCFVDSIDEREGKVFLRILDSGTREAHNLEFDAVFIAAGPINTTRMLLRSRKIYDKTITLKESQKFLVPMLRLHGAETAISHPAVTLASVFFETKVPRLSDHWLHMQVIPLNSMIVEQSGLPATQGRFGKALWSPVFRRLMMGWAGMHSDHSSELELRLQAGANGEDVLELKVNVLEKARAAAHLAARDLFGKGLKFNTLFCYWMLKFSNPGSGTHCGSSFPMRQDPKEPLDTDRFGRPFGWSKVCLVDASVLPSIPGTTLGFTVMANAYRIAATVPLKVG